MIRCNESTLIQLRVSKIMMVKNSLETDVLLNYEEKEAVEGK